MQPRGRGGATRKRWSHEEEVEPARRVRMTSKRWSHEEEVEPRGRGGDSKKK